MKKKLPIRKYFAAILLSLGVFACQNSSATLDTNGTQQTDLPFEDEVIPDLDTMRKALAELHGVTILESEFEQLIEQTVSDDMNMLDARNLLFFDIEYATDKIEEYLPHYKIPEEYSSDVSKMWDQYRNIRLTRHESAPSHLPEEILVASPLPTYIKFSGQLVVAEKPRVLRYSETSMSYQRLYDALQTTLKPHLSIGVRASVIDSVVAGSSMENPTWPDAHRMQAVASLALGELSRVKIQPNIHTRWLSLVYSAYRGFSNTFPTYQEFRDKRLPSPQINENDSIGISAWAHNQIGAQLKTQIGMTEGDFPKTYSIETSPVDRMPKPYKTINTPRSADAADAARIDFSRSRASHAFLLWHYLQLLYMVKHPVPRPTHYALRPFGKPFDLRQFDTGETQALYKAKFEDIQWPTELSEPNIQRLLFLAASTTVAEAGLWRSPELLSSAELTQALLRSWLNPVFFNHSQEDLAYLKDLLKQRYVEIKYKLGTDGTGESANAQEVLISAQDDLLQLGHSVEQWFRAAIPEQLP